MADIAIRRDEKLLCGRLVALPSTNTLEELQNVRNSAGFRNVVSIDFPAMPETIELARSADYAVNWNWVLPDGIHQYRGTKPLEIPISFKLHFNDEQYCKDGALTLLQLAGRLHSFVLPLSTYQRGVTVAPRATSVDTQQNGGRSTDSQLSQNASQNSIFDVQKVGNSSGAIYSPVTCWLHLMWVDNANPGVSAVGYVKDVNVKFGGPWLRGPANSFNLPTKAEFSFTFVHRPGHGNNTGISSSEFLSTTARTPQAFADDVKDRLYNTRNLVYAANYQGFATDSSPASTTAPTTATPPPAETPPTPSPSFDGLITPVT